MFGLGGISELVFILFLVMLIFGPEKMPEIARMVAKGLGEVRKASNELKRTLNAELALGEQEVEARRLAAAQAATAHAAAPALAAPDASAPPLTAQILPASPLAPFEPFPPTPTQAAPTIRPAALAVPGRAPGAGADRLQRPYSPSLRPTSHSGGDAPVFLVTPYAADRMLPYAADQASASAAHGAGSAGSAAATVPAQAATR